MDYEEEQLSEKQRERIGYTLENKNKAELKVQRGPGSVEKLIGLPRFI